MFDLLEDKNNDFFAKFKDFYLVCCYGLSNLLLDCLKNKYLATLIFTCYFELMNEDSMNFKTLAINGLENIDMRNTLSHPDYFNILSETVGQHIDRLLTNDIIKEGFKSLDSFSINAQTEEEAKAALINILDKQIIKSSVEEYEINQQSESEFLISPKNETIALHLKSLIPKELIIVPLEFRFSGKNLIGGKLAVKKFAIATKTNFQKLDC